MTPEARQAARLLALHELWRRGQAGDALLDAGQQEWLRQLRKSPPLSATVWNVGRQRGKTYDAVYYSNEVALRETRAIIRYCAKTKESVRAIVMPGMDELVATMPGELAPRQESEYEWVYPTTRARLVLFGTDAQSFTRGRGPRTHLQILDEAAFYQDLEGVEAALLPSLQTTGGRALYLSSPPESLGHPFVARVRAAQSTPGQYVHDTFWNNPRVDHEAVVRGEAMRLGMTREELLKSTYWRREYEAELVPEESRAVVPAWTDAAARECVREVPRPVHYDAYVGADWGFSPDPHGALWGWYDFPAATLVIEDELELHRSTVAAFARAAKAKERTLWGVDRWEGTLLGAIGLEGLPDYLARRAHAAAPRQPFLRVGDDDSIALAELASEHGFAVIPTRKDDKQLACDALNELVARRRLAIHPRCRRLVEQLWTATWDERRTEFERTAKDHADLIDALVYLVRNIRRHRDPRPPPRLIALAPTSAKPAQAGWEAALKRPAR